MSPEQADGRQGEIDARSDVYSLGAVVYEVLTGTPPYLGRSLHEILAKIVKGAWERPSERLPEARIPPELDRLVEKALARTPDRRYRSVEALKKDIEAHLAERPISAYRYTAWQRAKKWVNRNRTVSLVAGSSMAVILAFVVALVIALFATKAKSHELELEAERRGRAEEEARAKAADLELALARGNEKARREGANATRLLYEAKEGAGFFPVAPGRIREYERWLEAARALVADRALHASEKARLETQGTGREEDVAALGMERAILVSLDELAGKASLDVERWLEMARRMEEASSASAEAWRDAARSIRDDYDGLEIAPIPGLVPLGKDPASGLWEFEQAATAEGVPSAGAGRAMTAQRGIVLVLVRGGIFRMGCDSSSSLDERPAHDVDVEPFLVSKYEMTQGQWKRATGEDPSSYKGEPCRPVEQVSWEDAKVALERLGLRLPSEAQWEYAARAGTTGDWWMEDLARAGNLADQTGVRWGLSQGEAWDDGEGPPCPVGKYLANPFGLHDTIGNVWEWCGTRMRRTTRRHREMVRPGSWLAPRSA